MIIKDVFLDGKKSSLYLEDKSQILDGLDKKSTLVVTDENCINLFNNRGFSTLVLPPGEPSKNFSSIQLILSKAVELGLDRNALFVGVGGGVVCDMCAFAASIYLRGCRVKLVPTTLLSMVDASVGGKTGIDFKGFKNLVGAFYPAESVAIVPEFIKTLSDKEYLSGLGEVIKSALLKDEQLLKILQEKSNLIKERNLELLQDIIIRCIKVKAYFVENDFREGGIRAYLNLGHTFAHALESVEKLGGVTHGEAVAWGLLQASVLAKQVFDLPNDYYNRLFDLLSLYGYKTLYNGYNIDDFIDAIKHDKKKNGAELNFVIQTEIGNTQLVAISEDIIRAQLISK